MTPEQLQELKEKAELWDSLSDSLRTIFLGKFERPIPNLDGEITENGKGAEQFRYGKMDCELTKKCFLRVKDTITIKNTSNASSHVGLLEEENKEMVKIEKNFQVKFGSLSIGDKFECYGDLHLNYEYPKICKCVKVDDECGKEIDGIRFLMHKSDIVFI